MKRFIGYGIAVLALALLPTFSFARDGGYRGGHWGGGYSSYRGGGGHYYGHGGGWGRSSFGFSFGIYIAPRSYYSYDYYRPVYRSYYPAPYYYDAPVYDYAPVYVPGPTYIAPARRYYYDDCRYYYRPSIGFSVGIGGRYHYR